MPRFVRIQPVADTIPDSFAWREGHMIIGVGDPIDIRHPAWVAPPIIEASNDNMETWAEVDVHAASMYQYWRYPAPTRRPL